MAVRSKNYWNNRQFVYTSHLQSIETQVSSDFNMLCRINVKNNDRVIRGFAVSGVVGRPVSTITVSTEDSSAMGTSIPGGFYLVDGSTEVFGTPGLFAGSFAPSTLNYLGLLVSEIDDPNTANYDVKAADGTVTQIVAPAGIVAQHSYNVSVGIIGIPLAVIQTDASNNIVSITDARPLLFRAKPDSVAVTSDEFEALPTADGSIGSVEKMLRTLMTKVWMQGGQKWYSPSVDAHGMTVVADWTTTGEGNVDLTWTGIQILFDNAAGWFNTVSANTVNLTTNGDCLYVDLDRSQNATITATVSTLTALGMPAPGGTAGPGDRIVLAWRSGGKTYVRGQSYAVGGSISIATTTTYGSVLLNVPKVGTGTKVAVVDDGGAVLGSVLSEGLSRGGTGAQGAGAGKLSIGHGLNDTDLGIGNVNTPFEVQKTNDTVMRVSSDGAKSSGYLAKYQKGTTDIATLPHDGVPVSGTDLVLRNFVGFAQGKWIGNQIGALTGTYSALQGNMTSDGIGIQGY